MNEQELKRYVGRRIREERKKLRISQRELGERIGVKHNTISQYENATNSPEQDTLFKIAKVFDIRVDDLFPPMDIEDNNDNFERALRMAKDLEVADMSFLKSLIEKTLSMEGEEREKFLGILKFTMEFYERDNKSD